MNTKVNDFPTPESKKDIIDELKEILIENRIKYHNTPLPPPQHNMTPHLFSASQALIKFLETYQLTRPSMPHA